MDLEVFEVDVVVEDRPAVVGKGPLTKFNGVLAALENLNLFTTSPVLVSLKFHLLVKITGEVVFEAFLGSEYVVLVQVLLVTRLHRDVHGA